MRCPHLRPDQRRRWGYVSVVGNVLYGSTATAMTNEYGAVLASFLANGKWRTAADVPAAFRDEYEQLKKLYPDPKDLQLAAQRDGYMYSRMTNFTGAGEFTQKNAATKNMMVSDKVFALDTETGQLLWEYRRTTDRQHHAGPG